LFPSDGVVNGLSADNYSAVNEALKADLGAIAADAPSVPHQMQVVQLDAGSGRDVLIGGTGTDILVGDSAGDSGNDVLMGGYGRDYISGRRRRRYPLLQGRITRRRH
jgi:Ca2+-binding RTX toxin-like protein